MGDATRPTVNATFQQLFDAVMLLKENDEANLRRIIELEKQVERLKRLNDSVHPGWD